jgi:hypothetical protein
MSNLIRPMVEMVLQAIRDIKASSQPRTLEEAELLKLLRTNRRRRA